MVGLQLCAGPPGASVGPGGPALASQPVQTSKAGKRCNPVSPCPESQQEHQDPRVLQSREPANTRGRERREAGSSLINPPE